MSSCRHIEPWEWRGGGWGPPEETSGLGHSDEPVMVLPLLDIVYIILYRESYIIPFELKTSHYCRWKHGMLSSGSQKVSR